MSSSVRCGVLFAYVSVEIKHAVTQQNIEIVIGRLLTDEEFRGTFLTNPHRALGELLERGTQLSHAEIAALIGIDLTLWERVAEQIDPRLQKASLRSRIRNDENLAAEGDT
jgi:hypothetical protein